MLHHILMGCLVFLCCLIIDYVYVKWMTAVQEKRLLAAMIYSGLCPLIAFLSFVPVIQDYWLLAPTAFGHAMGTFVSMRFKR